MDLVFVAACRLSLIAVSGGYSLVVVAVASLVAALGLESLGFSS